MAAPSGALAAGFEGADSASAEGSDAVGGSAGPQPTKASNSSGVRRDIECLIWEILGKLAEKPSHGAMPKPASTHVEGHGRTE